MEGGKQKTNYTSFWLSSLYVYNYKRETYHPNHFLQQYDHLPVIFSQTQQIVRKTVTRTSFNHGVK